MNQNILTYLACICFIFLLGRFFIIPIKTIIKLILNSILGGVLIYIINIIGMAYNFHIGINLVTTICIGLLGVPGAILLVVLKVFLRIIFLAFLNYLVYYYSNKREVLEYVWYCWLYRKTKSNPNSY